MNRNERSLARDRAARSAARGAFHAHVARLKGDIDAHGGIVGKAKAEAGKRALEAGKQGLAIARESKGIIAGTVAALGLWFFRRPLIESARSWIERRPEPDGVQEEPARAGGKAQEE